jgi:chemotaxis signal transduction protein
MPLAPAVSCSARPDTESFLPLLPDVARCEQSLQELNLMWRLIESSAKMNCPVEAKTILPNMAATRSSFAQLEKELVASLVQEKVRTVMDGIGTKAQYVIDIVVRNLYERTADVGFLATDRVLCDFVVRSGQRPRDEENEEDRSNALRRLREYQSKYTVYDEILVLDIDGNVLVHIDRSARLEHSSDPLIAETLASGSYVETFRKTDLRPNKDRALVYSRRMHDPASGAVVGLLCLCFNFEEEMRGIFHSHRGGDERANLLLLDEHNRVITSADPVWIPPGTLVPANPANAPSALVLGGREYLVCTVASGGYQGYPGPPGWRGQAMIPVDVAFRGTKSDLLSRLDPSVAEGLLSHADSFCPPLHDIMNAARTIQRIVWNGQVMTAGQQGDMQKLKTILEQISETGNRSNELFERSIHNLYQTVLASSLRDAQFISHLLVDLLDRNLYERSDDCRWWALAPELRAALSSPGVDEASAGQIRKMLVYINGLYTVYTRIFVYDRHGRIVASTGIPRDSLGAEVTGSEVTQQALSSILALQSPQDYHASPFETSPLYGGRHTYIYHAAIRDVLDGDVVTGGIGIVFDAEPEFRNMLQSGIADKPDMLAFYVDRQGMVLSSTDGNHPVGSRLDLDTDLLALPNGQGTSRITVHDGQYAIVACTVSSGYREFKVADGYCEDVIAVVYRLLGAVREAAQQAIPVSLQIERESSLNKGLEFATFFCNGQLYAIEALHVLEAVPFSDVRTTSLGGSFGRIGILGLARADLAQRFIWVYDLAQLFGNAPATATSSSQVMVVRLGGKTIGLLVDDLHAVPQFDPEQIFPSPLAPVSGSVLTTQVIRANRGTLLIQVLDADRLVSTLFEHAPAIPQDGA